LDSGLVEFTTQLLDRSHLGKPRLVDFGTAIDWTFNQYIATTLRAVDRGPDHAVEGVRRRRVLLTVRWYDSEPVGDGYVQGEFRELERVVGCID
jgi:hypothetical protein